MNVQKRTGCRPGTIQKVEERKSKQAKKSKKEPAKSKVQNTKQTSKPDGKETQGVTGKLEDKLTMKPRNTWTS